MAFQSSDQEEMLLALLSMGFEYENCKQVLDDGVTVLEIAIESDLFLVRASPSGFTVPYHFPV